MIAALGDLEKGRVRRSGSDARSGVIVEVLWNTDVLPDLGIRLLPSKDLDDFRHFAGSDEKVHLGQFLR